MDRLIAEIPMIITSVTDNDLQQLSRCTMTPRPNKSRIQINPQWQQFLTSILKKLANLMLEVQEIRTNSAPVSPITVPQAPLTPYFFGGPSQKLTLFESADSSHIHKLSLDKLNLSNRSFSSDDKISLCSPANLRSPKPNKSRKSNDLFKAEDNGTQNKSN